MENSFGKIFCRRPVLKGSDLAETILKSSFIKYFLCVCGLFQGVVSFSIYFS